MNGSAVVPPLRLAPAMASLRLQVLKFTQMYIARWGEGPSYAEIAHATNTNRTRVKWVVRALIAEGLLLRAPGVRGLYLPDQRDAALRVLRDLGWSVDTDGARLLPPSAPIVTNPTLQAMRALDYAGDGSMADRRQHDGAEENKIARDRDAG